MGQGAPKRGCANEGGPGCIPAPLALINLIRPLHISGDAELPAPRGAARGAPLHAAEVARGPWEQLGPDGRIAPGPSSGHGAPEPQEQSGGGALEPPPRPRRASAAPPRGTSVPRPRTDPMRTIRAAVGGNQARRGVTLAGPRDGGSAALGQPTPLRAGFGAAEARGGYTGLAACSGLPEHGGVEEPSGAQGLQSWGPRGELPPALPRPLPGRTVPAAAWAAPCPRTLIRPLMRARCQEEGGREGGRM